MLRIPWQSDELRIHYKTPHDRLKLFQQPVSEWNARILNLSAAFRQGLYAGEQC